ncbi:zinc-binding alcohol dehydrogenase family protein [Thalassospira marina]|uniref:Dehydrogenase n=1 Tax=Thalassospira marina TaxID=2048283 RepID=A0A2N3KEU9_9PROT|nr:zinc-binding alcohol dehydrogenase family protein [Thalassospira marina]PKR49081.1 dehydrogenase [Thalassospira marina]
MTVMKTIVCVEPGTLASGTAPTPEAKEGHIRVAIRSIGICGTDYHIMEGLHPFLQYPRVMGHELSGTALDASSDGSIAVGDLVVVNPYVTCGTCHACRIGKPNCCMSISVLGVHGDGGMCDQIRVPEGNLYPAQGLSARDAAMVEFLAIGAHAVSRSRIAAGTKALVVGAGPIGIGTALFASFAGAEITLRDTSQQRLDRACAIVKGSKGVLVNDANADLPKDGFETVYDATGNINAMNVAINDLAHGGTLVFVGVVKGELRIDDPEFHKRETTLMGSRNALREDFEKVMHHMRAGDVPVDLLNTHEGTFDNGVEQLSAWLHDREDIVKAILHVG